MDVSLLYDSARIFVRLPQHSRTNTRPPSHKNIVGILYGQQDNFILVSVVEVLRKKIVQCSQQFSSYSSR